jgi:flagellar biosynthesis/type III secretory pathway protein FliH
LILFGEDFDFANAAASVPPHGAAAQEAVVLAATAQAEAEAEAAREAMQQSAYAQGFADGQARAMAEREARADHWTTLCAQRLRDADAEVAELADAAASSVAGLMFDVLAKLLPDFCARHGKAEIAALTRDILPTLRAEPRIILRVNPHDVAVIEDVLGEIPADLRGSITMTPTDSVGEGDLQVKWQDGGVSRDTRALLGQVTDLLRQFGFVHEHA